MRPYLIRSESNHGFIRSRTACSHGFRIESNRSRESINQETRRTGIARLKTGSCASTMSCRGTWARVTIDQFRRLALQIQNCMGHRAFFNILRNKMLKNHTVRPNSTGASDASSGTECPTTMMWPAPAQQRANIIGAIRQDHRRCNLSMQRLSGPPASASIRCGPDNLNLMLGLSAS